MISALERRNVRVNVLPWIADPPSPTSRLARRFTRRGKPGHDWSVSADHAHAVHRAIRDDPVDVVLAVAASTQSARLRLGGLPLVASSDATFGALVGQYPRFDGLSAAAIKQGERIERASVRAAAALVYPSRWAADHAVEECGADPARISVIPFGPNLDVPSGHIPRAQPSHTPTMLFVGAQWERKGGDVAVSTARRLAEVGSRVRLVCVGAPPPPALANQVDEHLLFNKSDPAQARALAELYSRADVLVLPSRADCSPVVLCEAAAFGLPAIATSVGGIPELVKDGVTGRVLPVGASVDEWARAVEEVLDPSRYASLSAAARDLHRSALNWESWAADVEAVLAQVVARSRGSRPG